MNDKRIFRHVEETQICKFSVTEVDKLDFRPGFSELREEDLCNTNQWVDFFQTCISLTDSCVVQLKQVLEKAVAQGANYVVIEKYGLKEDHCWLKVIVINVST